MRVGLLVAGVVAGVVAASGGLLVAGESREEKVRGDKQRVEAQGWWIYDDLPKGFEEARASGKPLAVALRCIPCEECVKLDDELVDEDPRLKPLLEQFVRVRVISTNTLDLSTFQFDTDQSFLVFLLRADGTIYGRFGTRSDHTEWADDVSIEGLARALEGALEMHAAWPRDQAALAAKRGPPPPFPTPVKHPELSGKYGPALDYAGKVVPSCIHCHQLGEAERTRVRREKGALPEELLFPFPHPTRTLGLVLDPKQRAVVKRVESGGVAAAAGFRAGDVLEALAGQPLLSIADVQWVLHATPASGGAVSAAVRRGAGVETLTLALAPGWRRADDLSWRASTWLLRRMALGGMKLEALSGGERAKAGVPKKALGLEVQHVGQYAPHDRAKRAGVRKGDVLLSVDGLTDLPRETDLLRYALNEVAPDAQLTLEILRGRERLEIRVPTAR
jgi:serine protease Do